MYRVLADAVVLFHVAWIALMIFGGVFALVWKQYRPYHLVVVLSTLASQLLFLGCPLVALENALRRQYDPQQVYVGSFICYYADKHLGLQISPLCIFLVLVGIVLVAAFLVFHTPKEQYAA